MILYVFFFIQFPEECAGLSKGNPWDMVKSRNQKTPMNRFGGVKGGLTLSKHVIRPSLHPGEDEISIHGGKILVQQHGVLLQIGFVTWNLGEKS